MIKVVEPTRYSPQCNSCHSPTALVLRVGGTYDSSTSSISLCNHCAREVVRELDEATTIKNIVIEVSIDNEANQD